MSPRRPLPTGRRSVVAAIFLSLLVAGLGHFFVGRLARGAIWLGGSLAISLILRGGDLATWVPLTLLGGIGLLSALDVWMLLRWRAAQG